MAQGKTVTVPKTKKVTGKRRQIGILGGTFNPIHTGHLNMAEQARDILGLDEVLFMPDNIPPHKQKKDAISVDDRVEMVRLAIEDNPYFKLDLTDVSRGGVSYTYETIKLLKEQMPNDDLYFIIGADMVNDLPNWKNIDELVKLVTFVGVVRPGVEINTTFPILWVNAPMLELSSTDIRKRVKHGKTIKYIVPDKVAEYIYDKGLFL